MSSLLSDTSSLYLVAAVIAAGTLTLWLWRITGLASEVEWGGPWLNRIDGLNRLFCRYYHRLHGDNLYLPESGPAIVVANHVSGLDSLLLIAASKRRLRFLIAKEYYYHFGLNWLFRAAGCIPVDRKGRPERAFRAALKALEAGDVVALFPHGKIHLDSEPPRKLKPGAVRLAQLADCPIFPARIGGVRAEGHIVLSVLLRGRVSISNFPAIDCHEREPGECLTEIERAVSRPPPDESLS